MSISTDSAVERFANDHEYLAPTAILGLITCLWFWPLLTGEQLGQSFILHQFAPWLGGVDPASLPERGPFVDAAVAFHPWAEVARDQILSGHLPLWNPTEWAGMALLGNLQSALLFPPSWLLILMPFGYGWGVLSAVKVLLSGLGAFTLARQLGVGRGGALVAGVVYMLSAPLMLWLQYPLGSVFAIFPWLMWATTRLARQPTPASIAAVGIATALLLFAGHPESAFIAVSAIAVYLATLVAFDHRAGPGGSRPFRIVVCWAAGGLLGAAIAAVALIPFLVALGDSVTWDERGKLIPADAPSLADLLQWAMPGLFGDGEPNLYGRWPFGYFGLPAVILALVGLVRYRRDSGARALLAMTAVTFLAIYRVPPVRWVLEEVPPWANTYLGPERLYFIIALAGAVGAGAGVHALVQRPLPLRRVVLVTAATVLVIGLGFGVAQAAGDLGAPRSVKRESIAITAVLVLAAGVLLAALGRIRPVAAVAAALAVAVLSLAGLQNFNLTLPPNQAYPAKPRSIAQLQSRPGPFRVGVFRASGTELTMPANTAGLYGLESIEGYDYPLSRRWSDFQSSVLGFGGSAFPELRTAQEPPRGAALAALRMMNVRYYVGAPGTRPESGAFETVYSGRDAVILRDRAALPRAYVAPAIRPLSDDDALAVLKQGGLDPRREALVPAGVQVRPGRAFRAARVEVLAPDHVRVHVPRGAAGWLVLANSYSREWKAEVDGRDTEVRPTNFATMGVPVSSGTSVVDFRLDRTNLWLGAAISLVTLTCVALLAVSGRRRRRRAPAPTPRS